MATTPSLKRFCQYNTFCAPAVDRENVDHVALCKLIHYKAWQLFWVLALRKNHDSPPPTAEGELRPGAIHLFVHQTPYFIWFDNIIRLMGKKVRIGLVHILFLDSLSSGPRVEEAPCPKAEASSSQALQPPEVPGLGSQPTRSGLPAGSAPGRREWPR